MRKLLLCSALGAVIMIAACSSSTVNSNNQPSSNGNSSGKTETPATTTAPATGGGIKFPVSDFPALATTAKPGEYILAPEYDVMANASLKGLDVVFGEFYQHKMETPGAEMSAVKFANGKVEPAPNPFLIAIPAGQTAKKGDIVLTYVGGWGMQRAIVIDDADPAGPNVAMLDRDYVDPPKYPTDKIETKLEPNTFVKVSGELASGASIYVTGSNTLSNVYTVVNASGEKVLARTPNGYFKAFDKSECHSIPFAGDFKPGDKVRAALGSALAPATVTKVDPRIGRIWVTSDNSPGSKPTPKSYGTVVKD